MQGLDLGPEKPRRSPSVFSQALFAWLFVPVWKGFRQHLQESQMPKLFASFDAAHMIERGLNWKARAMEARPRRCPLWHELVHLVGFRLYLGLFLSAVQGLVTTVGRPLTLRYAVRRIESVDLEITDIFELSGILAGIILLDGFLNCWSKLILGDQVSTLCFSMVSNLLVGKATSATSEVGSQLANLLGNDLSRIIESLRWTFLGASAITGLVGGIVMLLVALGWSSIIGLFIAFSILGLNSYISKFTKQAEKGNLASSDTRVKLLEQAIVMIRGVKYFSWERQCLRQLSDCRTIECLKIRRFRNLQMLNLNIGRISPILSCLATFIVYGVVLGQPMETGDIFSALLIFQTLRTSLILIPQTMMHLANIAVYMKRIEEALLGDDFLERRLLPADEARLLADLSFESCTPSGAAAARAAEDGGPAAGQDGIRSFALQGISLSVEAGAKVALLGPVGSGKSTLLSALLGYLPLSGDKAFARTCAHVSLVPQKPIILNATIMENITMGLPFDEARFGDVASAAQLVRDLEQFSDGSNTLVGERGTTLSGGQQMRVNIARALYAQPDLLVMDDPLAALDHVVGSKVLDSVCAYVAGVGSNGQKRAVVMALNQVHFLSSFTHGIWLDENGSVQASGDPLKVAAQLGLHVDAEDFHNGSVDECSGATVGQEQPLTDVKVAESSEAKGMVAAEHRESGNVKANVYFVFLRAAGPALSLLTLLTMIVSYVAMALADRWLAVWMQAGKLGGDAATHPLYPGVYAALALGHAVLLVLASALFAEAGMRASRTLHLDCLTRLLRAPLAWFEDTPSGRIISRFSTDLAVVDVQLTMILDNFCQMLFVVIVMLGIVVSIVPMVAVAVLVATGVYIFQTHAINCANREVKRAKDAAMAPVLTNLSEARASIAMLQVGSHDGRLQKFFLDRHVAVANDFNRFLYLSNELQNFGSYLTYVMSFFCSGFTACTILATGMLDAELSALAFTYCFLVPYFLGIVSMLFVMANHVFTSLERLLELCSERVPAEAWPKDNDFVDTNEVEKTAIDWPTKGMISLEDVQLRYRAGLPLVLKGISLSIDGGERLGIVGRTGAGKSTLSVLLFRLVEPAGGRVSIDGVDIASVGLHKLRSSIGMIPQSPVLVQGTLRHNLDPFREHPGGDAAYKDACKRAQLGDDVNLDAEITAGGASFSQGEGQLISFARCLLRDTKIVCLDEPTASVDLETDAKLQQLVRKAFSGRTLLCIAHRLQTIIDFDRILVMEGGEVADIGKPAALLADPTSAFSKIVDGGGGGTLRRALEGRSAQET